jgi:hypothetical protein
VRKRFFALLCLLLCAAVLLPAAAGALELDRTQLPGYYIPLGTPTPYLRWMAKDAGWRLNVATGTYGACYAISYPSNQDKFQLNGADDRYCVYTRLPKREQEEVVVGYEYEHVCDTEAEAKAECSAMLQSLKQIHEGPSIENGCLFTAGRFLGQVTIDIICRDKTVRISVMIPEKQAGLPVKYGYPKGGNPALPQFEWEPLQIPTASPTPTPLPTSTPRPTNNSVVDSIKNQMIRDTQDALGWP